MKWLASLIFLCAAPVAAQNVFVLGETHDNPLHHAEQANLIAEIAPTALIFEMLSPEQAKVLNASERDAALGDLIGWQESGWPDFAMYLPVFTASDAPVYGASVPRDDLMAAIGTDAASVFGDDAEQFGLLEPAPKDMRQEQADAHCGALPDEMLDGMVEAQRLRDASFARTTLQALDETGGPVVLISGSGHARIDRGVPAYIANARPDVEVYSIGIVELETVLPFDEIITTEAAEREDPCNAFR
ncbi:ChaN family lipoprotein [Marivivens donghaensis]|uniref:ChaN family lipoprotein n=1 Tax=Marivivens donghaensis TaxID=1699413 RepID=A0ABX0VT86_9RHOB|nr:ChaN family lipoprotein [Marivivens donghaensis]NIY71197.1 ChaN family lipoprotein [Marivivens donghaensis]